MRLVKARSRSSIRHTSAYDEMIGGPDQPITASNMLEVSNSG
ncbi:MAG: DUF6482 family protein [Porticoccaceae bacterium]